MGYKAQLEELSGTTTDVTVERDGASAVKGTVESVDEDSCCIKTPGKGEYDLHTTIEFRDIRGVATIEIDPNMVG